MIQICAFFFFSEGRSVAFALVIVFQRIHRRWLASLSVSSWKGTSSTEAERRGKVINQAHHSLHFVTDRSTVFWTGSYDQRLAASMSQTCDAHLAAFPWSVKEWWNNLSSVMKKLIYDLPFDKTWFAPPKTFDVPPSYHLSSGCGTCSSQPRERRIECRFGWKFR